VLVFWCGGWWGVCVGGGGGGGGGGGVRETLPPHTPRGGGSDQPRVNSYPEASLTLTLNLRTLSAESILNPKSRK